MSEAKPMGEMGQPDPDATAEEETKPMGEMGQPDATSEEETKPMGEMGQPDSEEDEDEAQSDIDPADEDGRDEFGDVQEVIVKMRRLSSIK